MKHNLGVSKNFGSLVLFSDFVSQMLAQYPSFLASPMQNRREQA